MRVESSGNGRPASTAADRRAQLEQMALRLAFDTDALEQRGAHASPQDVAALAAAAHELRRAWLAGAFALGGDDPAVLLARTVLEGFDRESSRLAPDAAEAGDVFTEAIGESPAAVRRGTPAAAGPTRTAPTAWAISSDYLEACNCEPMCSCRSARELRQRRPRRGVCTGALAWKIEHGYADDVTLDGLAIVLAFRHDQDELD